TRAVFDFNPWVPRACVGMSIRHSFAAQGKALIALSVRSADCLDILPENPHSRRDFLISFRTRMYIIDVRPVSGILPSIFALDYDPHPSYLGATDVVLTPAPESDAEEPF